MNAYRVKKRDLVREMPLVGVLKLVAQILVPIMLFVGIMYATTFFSNATLKLENEKHFYETKLIDLQNNLDLLEKNIESVMIGSEIIK